MNRNLIGTLKSLDLSEYESRIYLSLLELGESTSGKILSKSGINSGKIYTILESLANKGLVTEIIKNKVRHFRAVDPRSLGKYLDDKQEEFIAKRKMFESILPDLLKTLTESASGPEIRMYTGFEGMKSAFDQELFHYAKNKELLVFGVIAYKEHNQALVRYFTNIIFRERKRKKIIIKKILSKNAKENVLENGAQVRFMDYNSFFTYNIIDDLVIFSIWSKEPIFITIRSKEVSDGLRKNFNSIWKTAKK